MPEFSSSQYLIMANAVLVLHALVVVFVIGGLAATLLGGLLRWSWTRNAPFRALHLGAIGFVAGEAWAGVVCPLTTLEQWLRLRAGQLTYEGDFIAYWLARFMFFNAPSWVFIAAYSVFAMLVLATWIWLPPRRRQKAGSCSRHR
jgi:hypothetical protein